MTHTTGVWESVDNNAATFEKIRRLRSVLRRKASLEVLAVVAPGDRPSLARRVRGEPVVTKTSVPREVHRSARAHGRESDTDSVLAPFLSEEEKVV